MFGKKKKYARAHQKLEYVLRKWGNPRRLPRKAKNLVREYSGIRPVKYNAPERYFRNLKIEVSPRNKKKTSIKKGWNFGPKKNPKPKNIRNKKSIKTVLSRPLYIRRDYRLDARKKPVMTKTQYAPRYSPRVAFHAYAGRARYLTQKDWVNSMY